MRRSPTALRDAAIRVLADWPWAQRPASVVAMPSRRRPQLVESLARSLADAGRLPFLGTLPIRNGGPSGEPGGNSVYRLAGLWDRFDASDLEIPDGPVLLVDDIADSRWTLTVASRELRRAGATRGAALHARAAGVGGRSTRLEGGPARRANLQERPATPAGSWRCRSRSGSARRRARRGRRRRSPRRPPIVSITDAMPWSAQKSSISCVSRMPPMFDPASERRAPVSENTRNCCGFSGSPTKTSAPSRRRVDRYRSTSMSAPTVLMMRSKRPRSDLQRRGVLGGEVLVGAERHALVLLRERAREHA